MMRPTSLIGLSTLIGLAVLALALPGRPVGGEGLAHFATGELTIETGGGARHFAIEIARTPDELAQGLMYRDHLDADHGMLFLIDPPRPVTFWMKNTLIPLDIIFVKTDGRVESVAARAIPMSTETIPSQGEVGAVVEVNGGMAERLGIRPGDKVVSPALGGS
jgi:uncharacterized protein